jgi:diguanylate cyclase (GGDEF)-like protein
MMFIWNADRPGPGLIRIASGDLLIGSGLLVPVFRSYLPGSAIDFVSGLLIFAGAISILTGVCMFRGFRPLTKSFLALVSAAYFGVFAYWLFVSNDPPARAALSSVALAVISISLAVAMARDLPPEDRRLYVFSAFIFGLHSFSLLVRAAWAVAHHGAGTLQPGSPADFTVMLSLNFVTKGCCFAIAIASSRKLYHNTRILALIDPLTQLANRRSLDDRLAKPRPHSPDHASSVALIYLDLDNFKAINDTFGHLAGDEALRIVSKRLQATPGMPSFPARLGGDEFVLLLEDVRSRSAASSFMETVVRSVESEMTVSGQRVSLTVSCGIALYPDDVANVSDLMRAADDSMYRAKRSPRQFNPFPSPQFDS